MIRVTVNNRGVQAIPLSPVTVGSEGIVCAFLFSDDWAGLAKTAIFRGSGEEVEYIILNNQCVVPAEVLAEAGGMLEVGVYGNDGHGTTIRPTIWGVVGRIEDGAISEDAGQTGTTPSWAAQLQIAVQDVLTTEAARVTAEDAREDAEEDRADAEEARVTAEAARAAAETARASAETSRASAETARASAESSRASAESARATAETARASAEEERAAAEAIREENYATYVEAVGEYADAASASATAAAGSATSAASSASSAAASAGQAVSSASSASTSAGQASTSASAASSSASTASSAATTATTQAGIATTKAQEAAASATDASGSATAAETAQAAAEAAQEAIEDAAAQIAQNTQDIADLEDEKYEKPATGIPATDLASAVQASLGKADSAYQKPAGGIPATDLASSVQTSLEKADTALQTAPVSSVAGKTGPVTLDAGDVEFDETETYAAGSVGAELSQQKNAISQLDSSVYRTKTKYVLPSASRYAKAINVQDGKIYQWGSAYVNQYNVEVGKTYHVTSELTFFRVAASDTAMPSTIVAGGMAVPFSADYSADHEFTWTATYSYMFVGMYNPGDCDIVVEVVGEEDLSNTYIAENAEKISDVTETTRNIFDKNHVNRIDGYIYGSGNHNIVAGETPDEAISVFVPVQPSTTYMVTIPTLTASRLAAGATLDYPTIGTNCPVWVANYGGKSIQITTGEASKYLVVWVKSGLDSLDDYAKSIDGLQIEEGATASTYIEHESATDYVVRNENQTKFTVATWNIGHFSNGTQISSAVTDANYDEKRTAFRGLINDLNADLFGLQEYTSVWARLTGGNKTAAEDLFQLYRSGYVGQAIRYSCNAEYTNLPLSNLQKVDYDCNQDAVITHTTAIQATDYYYLKGKLRLMGKDITVIITHCAFDLNNTQVETDQYAELVEKFGGEDRVIILGDFNATGGSSEFDVFTNAGFTLANHGYMGDFKTYPSASTTSGVLDNIIVKGLQMSNIRMIETDLSDHNVLACDLTL